MKTGYSKPPTWALVLTIICGLIIAAGITIILLEKIFHDIYLSDWAFAAVIIGLILALIGFTFSLARYLLVSYCLKYEYTTKAGTEYYVFIALFGLGALVLGTYILWERYEEHKNLSTLAFILIMVVAGICLALALGLGVYVYLRNSCVKNWSRGYLDYKGHEQYEMKQLNSKKESKAEQERQMKYKRDNMPDSDDEDNGIRTTTYSNRPTYIDSYKSPDGRYEVQNYRSTNTISPSGKFGETSV